MQQLYKIKRSRPAVVSAYVPVSKRDDEIFEHPDQMILDWKPNPHVGVGFSPHHCLRDPHARLDIWSFLKPFSERFKTIQLIHATPKIEHEETFSRMSGYTSVSVRVTPRWSSKSFVKAYLSSRAAPPLSLAAYSPHPPALSPQN